VLVTGALHEDGSRDTADGSAGAKTAGKLAVMRDSRIGAYGVLALVFSLALRRRARCVLTRRAPGRSLIAAHASRAGLLIVMRCSRRPR
jgi:adenosylcobinamide-GDP ribazoletransferase